VLKPFIGIINGPIEIPLFHEMSEVFSEFLMVNLIKKGLIPCQ
jgi:hypothetical protein